MALGVLRCSHAAEGVHADLWMGQVKKHSAWCPTLVAKVAAHACAASGPHRRPLHVGRSLVVQSWAACACCQTCSGSHASGAECGNMLGNLPCLAMSGKPVALWSVSSLACSLANRKCNHSDWLLTRMALAAARLLQRRLHRPPGAMTPQQLLPCAM